MVLSSTEGMCFLVCGKHFPVFYHKRRRQKIYCEGRGKILRLMNSFLHESLFLHSIIILNIFFCNLNTCILFADWPQNIMPYDIIKWK